MILPHAMQPPRTARIIETLAGGDTEGAASSVDSTLVQGNMPASKTTDDGYRERSKQTEFRCSGHCKSDYPGVPHIHSLLLTTDLFGSFCSRHCAQIDAVLPTIALRAAPPSNMP